MILCIDFMIDSFFNSPKKTYKTGFSFHFLSPLKMLDEKIIVFDKINGINPNFDCIFAVF